MHMVIPTGHTVYTELDLLLAESDSDAPVMVTQYRAPALPDECPADLESAIDEQILAGLVCV